VAPDPDNTRITSGNLLTPNVGDPNTRIPESKAFMVNIEKEA
jgi:formate dehydrogenase major subunit